MLAIRLSRVGKKNHPQYRVVVQDKRKSPKGKCIETLGYYHPLTKTFSCEQQRISEYIKNGAQPSSTVARLLQKNGMTNMEKFIEKVAMKTKKGAETKETESVKTEQPAKEVDEAPVIAQESTAS